MMSSNTNTVRIYNGRKPFMESGVSKVVTANPPAFYAEVEIGDSGRFCAIGDTVLDIELPAFAVFSIGGVDTAVGIKTKGGISEGTILFYSRYVPADTRLTVAGRL